MEEAFILSHNVESLVHFLLRNGSILTTIMEGVERWDKQWWGLSLTQKEMQFKYIIERDAVHIRGLSKDCVASVQYTQNRCRLYVVQKWHYSDVIMSVSLKSLASRFVQVQIKENMKAPHRWPLWGNPSVTSEFPSPKAPYMDNVSIGCCHHGIIS